VVDPRVRDKCLEVQARAQGRDLDREIIEARYEFLDAHEGSFYEASAPAVEGPRLTERIDRILIHPVYGFAAFLAIMVVLFQSLFTWADPAIGVVEDGISAAQALIV